MLRSRTLLWLSVFILPPLGLVLLWMRGDGSVLRRMAAKIPTVTPIGNAISNAPIARKGLIQSPSAMTCAA